MFSEAVDLVQRRCGQTNERSRDNVIGYVNLTIVELTRKFDLYRDLTELAIDLSDNEENAYTWPRPVNFRGFRAVRYSVPYIEWPRMNKPGPGQRNELYYWYGTGTYFVFNGVSGFMSLDLAYYENLTRLRYYPEDQRPAKFDFETETWSYLKDGNYVSSLATEELEIIAQEKVSNWPLRDYFDTVVEGTQAKFFKTIDHKAAASTFAVYREMRDLFWSIEKSEGVPVSE